MFSSLRSRGAFRSSISMILMTVAFRVGAGRILSAEPDCSRNSGNFRGETAVLRFRLDIGALYFIWGISNESQTDIACRAGFVDDLRREGVELSGGTTPLFSVPGSGTNGSASPKLLSGRLSGAI